jgi:hypothetical protein
MTGPSLGSFKLSPNESLTHFDRSALFSSADQSVVDVGQRGGTAQAASC